MSYITHSHEHKVSKTMIDRFYPGEGARRQLKNGKGPSNVAVHIY